MVDAKWSRWRRQERNEIIFCLISDASVSTFLCLYYVLGDFTNLYYDFLKKWKNQS